MGGSTLLEVFGDVVYRFTRSATEHYNPEEPEYTTESFGYDPLQSTGREWYYHPVDEFIYQEYSDKDIRSFAYLASSSLDVQVINACSPDESTEEGNQEKRQEEDKEMAWKRLRPPVVQTVVKSMYIGGIISLLAASIVGTIYILLSYLNYKTVAWNCEIQQVESVSARMQWTRTLVDVIICVFYYAWPILIQLFLFRPHQLKGIKTKLIFVFFVMFILHALFRSVLQASGKPFFNLSALYRALSNVPVFIFVFTNVCVQFFFVARHLVVRPKAELACVICKMAIPPCSIYLERNDSFLELLQSFAIHTSVPLVIEWFFNSMSLAIETRYQNIAVMAVWRKRWKRHLLVAIVSVLPIAIWTSGNLVVILHGRFDEPLNQSCKTPFR